MISQEFWQDRNVFILGHTGFRGAHLAQTLQGLGAKVSGLGLMPKTNPSYFEIENIASGMSSVIGDACDFELLKSQIEFNSPEIIFSLLGGAGLKASKENPRETFETQMTAHLNLLEALRVSPSVRALTVLTSDKVYRQDLTTAFYAEDQPLGGSSPAVAAKAMTEILLESYIQTYFQPEKFNKHRVAIASARMGSVVGSGDFDPESLVWQGVQAIRADQKFLLRNPESVRSWMGMKDAIAALLTLGEALLTKGPAITGAWNFAPLPQNKVPVRVFMEFLGLASPEAEKSVKPSQHGDLSVAKAEKEIGWKPQESLSEMTADLLGWYQKKGFL